MEVRCGRPTSASHWGEGQAVPAVGDWPAEASARMGNVSW